MPGVFAACSTSKSPTGLDMAQIFSQLDTTAAIFLGESGSEMFQDYERVAANLIEEYGPWQHEQWNPGNAQSHVLSSFIGGQLLLPITNGRLDVGTWQRVIFLELDGPRQRHIAVAGLALCLAGIVYFRSVAKVLCIDAGKLTVTGPYRYSRNPQYVGWWLFLFGFTLNDWSLWCLGALWRSRTGFGVKLHSGITSDPLRDELVLVTCYPFAALVHGGPFRLVIRTEAGGCWTIFWTWV